MEDLKDTFTAFRDESVILARIMCGYATLELDLAHCVQVARNDFDAVLKAMFRARGETQRIDVADALGRQLYHNLNLGTHFEMALGAMRYCLKIRNQYSHCIWWNDISGNLAFSNLEEITKGNNTLLNDLTKLTPHHVNVSLLQSQENYFEYASYYLNWVNFEGRRQAGKQSSRYRAAPTQLTQPPLHIQ